jgi:filamentous hemagglutinin family protein
MVKEAAMKNNKQKADTVKTRVPQLGRLTLLAAALVATGALSPLSLPEAVAAPLPVPMGMPCGGCSPAANTPAGLNFVQYVQPGGSVSTSLDPSGKNLTINQDSQVAILNWQQFNIDKGYSVEFKQPSSTASALNRIWDANPTTIAGSLTANGQIYLVNQNGIVFANGAQVNTNTLIASSLDIDTELFKAGYLTNTQVIPAFSGVGGFVKVETDAVLNGSRIMLFAPVVENSGKISTPGGQTVLAAGHNIYLEASQDPNLRGVLVEVDVTNPGVADPLLKGYGLQHTEAGVVTNAGDIITERGNTTLVGFAVNQQGRISATTSVTENGSIKLLARYEVAKGVTGVNDNPALAGEYGLDPKEVFDIRATKTGKVTLATGSVTAITPQQSNGIPDSATITGDQTFNKSIVEVMGNSINMESGSSIIVPGGKVTLAAISSYVQAVAATATTPAVLASGLIPDNANNNANLPYQTVLKSIAYSSFLNPEYLPVSGSNDGARVFMDSGSLIDVSGSSATVSVARNILAVQLRGSQLADAPVQRTDGFLWGKDVLVDIRNGTPLANYAAEEAQIGRTAAELLSAGGSVKLVSTGDVVMKSGATVDLSGGQVNYHGANIKTSTLISNGIVYDIANAASDRIYDGISDTVSVTHKKWGITESFNTMAGGDSRGRWDAGYVEGKSAGTMTVLAPHAVIEGDIIAHTVAGQYQRQTYDPTAAATYKATWQMMAQGGSLVVGNSKAIALATNNDLTDYINDSNVTIRAGAPRQADTYSLYTPVSGSEIFLDAGMFGSANGLSNLAVYSNRTVKVDAGTTIRLAPGGSVTLQGDKVDMLGAIDAPSGAVRLGTAATISSASANKLAGALTVGAASTGSYISTRGQWVNDTTLFGVPDWSKPLVVNGGSISLTSGGDLLVAGALLDASGGAWLDNSNKLHGGNGGDITLKSGKSTVAFKTKLDGVELRSFGVADGKGGSLTLAASDINIGGVANTDTTLALPAGFFQNGGFTNYDLTSQSGNMTVEKGVVVEPQAQSLILDRTASVQVSGSDVTTFSTVGLLPEWQRKAAGVALHADNGGSLKIDEGAVIRVEPTASINLSATSQLTVLGTLDARAGKINLSLSDLNDYVTSQSIWLGGNSKLLSQGYFQQSQPNAQYQIKGQVLSGGSINISAKTGYVIAQKGSLMDVSGSTADIDLPQLQSGSLVYRRSHVAGNAGSIAVQTSEGALFDGNMQAGVEAVSQAAAGKFSLTLENSKGVVNFNSNSGLFPENPAQILLMADGNGSFATSLGADLNNDGKAGQVSLNPLAGKVLLDATALNHSGFDQVVLKSDKSIVLADQVDLQTRRSITLDALEFVSTGSGKVSSAHVTLGNAGLNQALLDPLDTINHTQYSPASGTGILNVAGQLLDLSGNFLVSGVKQLNLASSGDLRLNGVINDSKTALTGSLRTQGSVTLSADQVYPTTMAQFKLSVEDGLGAQAGKITVLPGQHSASPVMSAGGLLTLSANDIEQNGVVKAPMGSLTLDGSNSVTLGKNSLTSVSADGLTIPYGQIQGGNTWVYDLTGAGSTDALSTIVAPPQKQVMLTAPKIDVQTGATVNLSGGGDLYANEFFAGSGGSVNVLDPAKAPANNFAIVPGLSAYSPYDPQASGQYTQKGSNTQLQSGASVYLAGGNGIAAGYYTLLPASYALLPNAFRITAVSGYTDRQPGQGVTTLVDGSQIMAGKFAVMGTDIQDARYSGFMLTPGSVVRTQSEYHDSTANQFFTNLATNNQTLTPRLASDAGQLIISAVGSNASLGFDGIIKADASVGGRGALVDLNGPGFDIVNTKGSAPVYSADGSVELVQLTTSSLNNLGANSLLIGGVRSQSATSMNIAVSANEVLVDNAGSVLSGPEIILAANKKVAVKAGSDIEGTGTYTGQVSNLAVGSDTVNGDGALLRVSSAAQVAITRTNQNHADVSLSVENGATVGAQNAVLLDSSSATTIGNSAVINAKAFSVAAKNIDFGNTSPAATSLAISGSLLARVRTFNDLTLHSYNDINFYGDSALGGLDKNGQHILNNLVFDARNLNGINNAGKTNLIDATHVSLLNSNTGAATPAVAYAGGDLKINAEQITLGAGDKSIQGFNNVTLEASQQIMADGKSTVTVAAGDANVHNLMLQAGQITGKNKSDLTIAASNDVITISSVAGSTATASEALNAKLDIIGKRIADDGIINLAAGSVTLHAVGSETTDGVTLGKNSGTAATGIAKVIAGQTAYAQAGSVSLIADNGGVEIQSGALVDVSGAAEGGDAGSVNIAAAKGAVVVAGKLKGAANAKFAQGSFILDANTLALTSASLSGNALTDLNNMLSDNGFTALRDMRMRTGDWSIAADVGGGGRARAQTFRLTADAGMIDVYGTVDASGSSGGNILLASKNNLTLHDGALLDAHASGAGQAGGKVDLQTAGLASGIELNNQAINVHGASSGGKVSLRAARNATNDDVNLYNRGGTSLNVGDANVTVEAFKAYTPTLTAGQLGTTEVGGVLTVGGTTVNFKSEAADFASHAAGIKGRLGMLGKDNQHLTPGVEIDSATNLTLAKDWDLSDASWRFNNGNGGNTEAGILTLRTAGNLQFGTGAGLTASLTDGVVYANTNNTFDIKANGFNIPVVTPMSGSSWSFRLVSGADLSSADVKAVNNKKTGDFTLVAGKEVTTGFGNTASTKYYMEQIRTGIGFIDIAAGGNFNLNNRDSVIYTFGQPVKGVPVAGANGTDGINNKYFGADGGDVTILAKGDVNGAATDQLLTEWQWRQGLPNTDGSIATQPAWWINLQSFRQNVGALGGGNVSITAGGNINNLSAVAPSTGYVNMADSAHPAVVLGGGNLSITAAGDINSGIFYVGNGQGKLSAGGNFGSDRQVINTTSHTSSNLYTVLALGQGNFDVHAGGDLNLQTILNPTVIAQGVSQLPGLVNTTARSYFFTYGDSSGVALSSLSGDVSLGDSSNLFYKNTTSRAAGNTVGGIYTESGSGFSGFFRVADTADAVVNNVYPGSLQINSLGGSIFGPPIATLAPSSTGNLQLLADKNIQLGAGSPGFVMSDANPSGFETNTVSTIRTSIGLPEIDVLITGMRNGHGAIHTDDTQPVMISAGGDISGSLTLPKAAQIEAGQDVYNLGLNVQNLKNTDTTSVIADRDISYVYAPSATFKTGMTINGPGQLVLQAGRNVDLGRSDGVVTTGNLKNYLLPEQGASVTVLAGVGQGETATQAFIDQYIDPAASSSYDNDLFAYVGKYTGNTKLTATQAFSAFSALSKPLQEDFVRQVFFSELKQTGRSAVNTGNYQAGYDAIATLYPSNGYKGDINLYSSQIKTVRGGDINLLTPGGGVNAGLANGSDKAPSELGIVTVKGGDVNAFVNNDFLVNQSRVFTLQGGNILMWSSYGDIDAGKGSKSASSTPPPLLVVDPKTGTFNVDVTGSVVGSGIRVLLANKNVVPGDVDLIAPNGTVNAGDAGIGSAGNITIAALHVVGADNINFGGVSAGVPVAAPAPVSVGLSLQDASKVADEATQSLASVGDMNAQDFKPTFLSVEVIGMGGQDSNL